MANEIKQVQLPGSDTKYDLIAKNGSFYIEGTGSTAGTWLGTHDGIASYYPGLLVLYKIPVAGASTTTLNINGLGAVKVVRNVTTAISTAYSAKTIIPLVYTVDTSTAYWKIADYNTVYSAATQSKSGLMSAEDKIKLDEMEYATDEEIQTMKEELGLTFELPANARVLQCDYAYNENGYVVISKPESIALWNELMNEMDAEGTAENVYLDWVDNLYHIEENYHECVVFEYYEYETGIPGIYDATVRIGIYDSLNDDILYLYAYMMQSEGPVWLTKTSPTGDNAVN